MKITITVDAQSKVQLVKELNNIVENISRYNRFDAHRKFLQGGASVSVEGTFAKFAVVDEDDNYVSFHNDRKDANEAAGEKYSVINMTKGL